MSITQPRHAPGRGRLVAARAAGNHSFASQAGVSLIYVVIVISVVAAMAAASMSITSSTQFTQLRDNYSMQARYMAIAGLNYLASMRTGHRALRDETIEVRNENNVVVGSYTFESVLRLANLNVRARIVGVADPGGPFESRYVLEGEVQEDFEGIATRRQSDFDDFTIISSDPNKNPAQKVDGALDQNLNTRAGRGSAAAGGQANSDGSPAQGSGEPGVANAFSIGANEFQAFGSFVFTGDRTFTGNNCTEGECDFKTGVRFFMTVWYSANQADGLTVTLFNGNANNWNSIGGDSVHGEMMAYAGDSRVYSGSNIAYFVDPEGNGIVPPKIGIEIDNWGNENLKVCGSTNERDWYWFRGTNPVSGTRYDRGGLGGTSGTDHAAFVAWGLENPFDCAYRTTSGVVRTASAGSTLTATLDGARTYDDNLHTQESWLWNPRNYANTINNRDSSTPIRSSTVYSVAQSFKVEEPLVISQAVVLLSRNSSIATQTRVVRARIFQATAVTDGVYVPTGSPLATSLGDTDNTREDNEIFDVSLPNATDSSYAENATVFAPFLFKTQWTTSGAVTLNPGWYSLVLEYNDSTDPNNNVLVHLDSSSPTHPGNFATNSTAGVWTADTTRDMIFYVLFDPPDAQRTVGVTVFPPSMFDLINNRATAYDGSTNYSLLNRRMAVRVEVHRDGSTMDAERGGYPYRMIAWFRNCGDTTYTQACPGYLGTWFSDTSGDLSTSLNPPAMERYFYLNATANTQMEKFILAITEATGGATQNATFQDFIMQFRKPTDPPINEIACYNCTGFDF